MKISTVFSMYKNDNKRTIIPLYQEKIAEISWSHIEKRGFDDLILTGHTEGKRIGEGSEPFTLLA